MNGEHGGRRLAKNLDSAQSSSENNTSSTMTPYIFCFMCYTISKCSRFQKDKKKKTFIECFFGSNLHIIYFIFFEMKAIRNDVYTIHKSGVLSTIFKSARGLVYPGWNFNVRETFKLLRHLINCLEDWELKKTAQLRKIKIPD